MGTKNFLKKVIKILRKPTVTKACISYLQPNQRLLGKKIVVTGGGRGLGASMAEKFAKEGAEVLISGRNEECLKETSQKIGCSYLVQDISDPTAYDLFVKNAEAKLGGIDVLVNNAGISLHEKTFFDVTPETFDAQINTNIKGGFFLTQKVISLWKNKGVGGCVLFVSSETGEMADFRPYGFTKAATNSMVQGLAYLFAKDGIRINAVAPGVTCSDMTGRKDCDDLTLQSNLLGRIYLPEEVAETACFLVSDAANCLSGQIICCNNGKSVNARWKR